MVQSFGKKFYQDPIYSYTKIDLNWFNGFAVKTTQTGRQTGRQSSCRIYYISMNF